MSFAAGDRGRIVKHLNLHKDQAKADSLLAQLMTHAETFDTTNSTTYVADIQAALTQIETLSTEFSTAAVDSGIKRFEEQGFYEVEYRDGAATGHIRNETQGQIELIWRLLDPDDYLRQTETTGRVIRTL